MRADGITLVTGGSRGIGASVDAGFIAGSTWAAYGEWPETPGAQRLDTQS